jgi:hypothetical protein
VTVVRGEEDERGGLYTHSCLAKRLVPVSKNELRVYMSFVYEERPASFMRDVDHDPLNQGAKYTASMTAFSETRKRESPRHLLYLFVLCNIVEVL